MPRCGAVSKRHSLDNAFMKRTTSSKSSFKPMGLNKSVRFLGGRDVEPFESVEEAIRWLEGHLIERASFLAVILGHVRRVLFTPVGIFVL